MGSSERETWALDLSHHCFALIFQPNSQGFGPGTKSFSFSVTVSASSLYPHKSPAPLPCQEFCRGIISGDGPALAGSCPRQVLIPVQCLSSSPSLQDLDALQQPSTSAQPQKLPCLDFRGRRCFYLALNVCTEE